MKGNPIGIVKSNPRTGDARLIPAREIVVQDWVRDACSSCRYFGKSWSCPPGVGPGDSGKLTEYRRAVFLVFDSSRDRKLLEKAVLYIETSLKKAGFSRARGFFVSPCTACPDCSYPEKCRRPDLCRPTGESWGIDLMATSVRAGLPVELSGEGEDFKPVTLFLLE